MKDRTDVLKSKNPRSQKVVKEKSCCKGLGYLAQKNCIIGKNANQNGWKCVSYLIEKKLQWAIKKKSP
jgi:hypothetical protein